MQAGVPVAVATTPVQYQTTAGEIGGRAGSRVRVDKGGRLGYLVAVLAAPAS